MLFFLKFWLIAIILVSSGQPMLMEVSGKLFMVVLVQILPFPKSVKDLIIILHILIISSTVSHSDLISQSDLVSLSDIIHQSNGVSQSNLISHSVKLSALTSDCIELDFKEISYLVRFEST